MTTFYMATFSQEEDFVEGTGATCVFHGLFTNPKAAGLQITGLMEQANDVDEISVEDAETEGRIVPFGMEVDWAEALERGERVAYEFDQGTFYICSVTPDEQKEPITLL